MFKYLAILSFYLFFFSTLIAQNEAIRYEDYTYSADIKSVKFTKTGDPFSKPIVSLNENQSLYLSFDDMLGGYTNFYYEIIHCDKDWKRSDIFELDYQDGFNGEDITEYTSTRAIRSNYTHYNLTLPNDDCDWIISGNYLLAVYDEDTGDPIITRRFIVTENLVAVSWESDSPRNPLEVKTHHALNVVINYEQFRIVNPLEDLFVTIIQNDNWNNTIHSVSPRYTLGEQIKMDAVDLISFPALKEFRNFDTRSLKSKTLNVQSIEYLKESTNVVLHTSEVRANRNFLFDFDTNGGFMIANNDYPAFDVEGERIYPNNEQFSSEYSQVLFSLENRYEFDDPVYIVGGLTDWQAYEEFKMEYDEFDATYYCSVPLKQGRYDYMYALKKDNVLDMVTLEGSSFETENNYTILVYLRQIGTDYDRVIGYTSSDNTDRRR